MSLAREEFKTLLVVDRNSQRALGELMFNVRKDGRTDTKLFIEFMRMAENDDEAKRWFLPLMQTLSKAKHTSERQRLFRYGIVLHAMIDTLEPNHPGCARQALVSEQIV